MLYVRNKKYLWSKGLKIIYFKNEESLGVTTAPPGKDLLLRIFSIYIYVIILSVPEVTTTEFADVRQQALVDSIKALRDVFTAQLALDPTSTDLMAAIAALEAAIVHAC